MSEHATPTLKAPTHHPVIGTADGLRLLGGDDVHALDGAPITSVHSDGADLWVLVASRDLHRVADGTAELVASLGNGAAGTCVGTHGGTAWLGGDNACLWRLNGTQLEEVESLQDAPSRDEWHTPWGGPPAVFSMASDGTDLYVSVHVGGILRSVDGGSWVPTIDLHHDVHQVTVSPDGTVWAATGLSGLAESGDRGATWRYHSDGLHADYLLAVATVTDGVLVAASSGHAAGDGAVYRFAGGSFVRCSGLPDDLDGAIGPRQLAATGDHAVVALPNGDVYASHDGGYQWTRKAIGFAEVSEVTLHATTAVMR
ncbi:MAG: WD40/YVTN/BNR-like repeat-containing protein [Ilumatobacteraceae bacterium]